MQSGLAALFVTPSKKIDGDGDLFIDDEPFIDKRKLLSTTVAKGVLNDGEHTLIPVIAKMIHSADWECKRLVLKDGRIHIKTYITHKILTLILNFKQVLCESRMNFLSTTN
jgi:hypothetical protein